MKEMGITQSELADQLGISRGRMSQILSSEANPTIKLVGRITNALDLEARYVRKSVAKQAPDRFPVFDLENLNASFSDQSFDRTRFEAWVVNALPKAGGQWHNNDNSKSPKYGKKALAA
jgi:transcriptional regulator with XRE-family HTH domain